MSTTLTTTLTAAVAIALTALAAPGTAAAKGGDRAEQIAALKAEQARIRAEKEARGDVEAGFSFFGLFSDDDEAAKAARTPSPAPAR